MVRKPALLCRCCCSRDVIYYGTESEDCRDYVLGDTYTTHYPRFKCQCCGLEGRSYCFTKTVCKVYGSYNTMWTSKLDFVCRDCESEKLEETLDLL